MTFPFPTVPSKTTPWQSFNSLTGSTVTLNPSDKSARITLSAGNLACTQDGTGNHSMVRATQSATHGKGYWEFTLTGANAGSVNCYGGVQDGSLSPTGNNFGGAGTGWAIGNASNAAADFAVGFTSSGTAFVMPNATYGIAYDFEKGWGWVRNASGYRAGSPTTGTSPNFILTASKVAFFPGCSMDADALTTVTFNFGASAFTYSLP